MIDIKAKKRAKITILYPNCLNPKKHNNTPIVKTKDHKILHEAIINFSIELFT